MCLIDEKFNDYGRNIFPSILILAFHILTLPLHASLHHVLDSVFKFCGERC